MYQEALQFDAATIQAAGVRAMVSQTLCQAALVQQKSWSGIVVAMKCESLGVLLEKLRYDGVLVYEWSGSALDEGDEGAKWFI
nr:hypothetical protein [Tanacetum cinerariifolium]